MSFFGGNTSLGATSTPAKRELNLPIPQVAFFRTELFLLKPFWPNISGVLWLRVMLAVSWHLLCYIRVFPWD